VKLAQQEHKEYKEFRVRLAQLEPRVTKVILAPLVQQVRLERREYKAKLELLVIPEHKEYREFRVKLEPRELKE
jgi:hypothetical protein